MPSGETCLHFLICKMHIDFCTDYFRRIFSSLPRIQGERERERDKGGKQASLPERKGKKEKESKLARERERACAGEREREQASLPEREREREGRESQQACP